MPQSEIELLLTAKDKSASATVRSVANNVSTLDKRTKSAAKSTNKMADALKQGGRQLAIFQGPLGPAAGRLSALGSAMSSVGAKATLGISGILGVAAAMAKAVPDGMEYEKTMRILKFATDDANEAFKKAHDIANKYAVDIRSSVGEYAKLSAAVKDTSLAGEEASKMFEALVVSSSALGLSADETSGTFRAFVQMISKGNVQAEELRGQLGERLVGAFQMAAKALGMTTAELNKALEDGAVTAQQLLPKLSKLMQDEFQGTALEAADSLQGKLNLLGNAWYDLGVAMSETGILDVLGGAIDLVTDSVKGLASAMKSLEKLFKPFAGMSETEIQLNALTEQYYAVQIVVDSMIEKYGEEDKHVQAKIKVLKRLEDQINSVVEAEAKLEKQSTKKKKEEGPQLKIDQEGLAAYMAERNSRIIEENQNFFEKLGLQQESFLLTEQEQENLRYDRLIADIERRKEEMIRAGQDKIEVDRQVKEALEEAEKVHQGKLTKIQEDANKKRKDDMTDVEKFIQAVRDQDLKGALKAGQDMTAAIAKHNRQAFEANKAFAIGSVIMTTASGIMKAFSEKGPPFPFDIAQAALVAATGAAQLQAIKSQTFGGGGGSAPSVSSAAVSAPAPAAPPPLPQQQAGTSLTINVNAPEGLVDPVVAQTLADTLAPHLSNSLKRGLDGAVTV
jgi:tape measure domain-containing protein